MDEINPQLVGVLPHIIPAVLFDHLKIKIPVINTMCESHEASSVGKKTLVQPEQTFWGFD